MPRPYKKGTKAVERIEFFEVMSSHVITVENTIDVAVSKNALYQTEKRDLSFALKRLKEVLSRIR